MRARRKGRVHRRGCAWGDAVRAMLRTASFEPAILVALALGGCGSQSCRLETASFDAPDLVPIGGDRLCHAIDPNSPMTDSTCIEFESADPTVRADHLAQYRSMILQAGWEATDETTQFQRHSADGKCVDFLSIGFLQPGDPPSSIPSESVTSTPSGSAAPPLTGSISVTPMSRACECNI